MKYNFSEINIEMLRDIFRMFACQSNALKKRIIHQGSNLRLLDISFDLDLEIACK